MKSTNSGCWTCRDRKIRCGLQRPTCSNCLRSSRVCHGGGFRLAWPKSNDKRRAWTSSLSKGCDDRKRRRKVSFLNVSPEDIELFSEFANHDRDQRRQYREDRRARVRGLPPSKPISWSLLDERTRAPLQYFISSGAGFFSATHGTVLSPLVLRIGLSDSSASSRAVLHSILALSCSHLRRKDEAFAYRSSAVAHLSSALDANCGVKVSFQNIAASMLLCVFETYHVSDTAANWAIFLCGTKSIIKAALVDVSVQDEDFIAIKHWIYYYEVLSRFSIVHWLNEPEVYDVCHENLSDRIAIMRVQSSKDDVGTQCYPRVVFEAMSALIDLVLHAKGSDASLTGCQLRIEEVEDRLSRADRTDLQTSSDEHSARAMKNARCYHLCARIYLNRIVLGYNGSEIQHRRIVDDALSSIAETSVQDVPWPIFIAACEAQTDEQRRRVLNIPFNQYNQQASNNTMVVLRLVSTFWNLVDLDTEDRMSYVKKMSAVVSSSPFLPVLA